MAKVPEQMADEKRTHRKNILTLKKNETRGKKIREKKTSLLFICCTCIYKYTCKKEPQKEKNEMRKKIGYHIVDRPIFFFFPKFFPLKVIFSSIVMETDRLPWRRVRYRR